MAPPPPLDVVACCGTCTAWIVTDAEALRDGSWFETAVTVTTAGVGTLAGAVYTPVAACVAPGARVTRQIPGRPVSFP